MSLISKKRKSIIGLSIGVLIVASLALNIILFNKTVSYYKALNLLRLDPLETRFLKKFPKDGASKKNGPMILLFGDSRISQWRPRLDLPGYTLINRGVGGQTTQQLMLRLEKDLLSYSPDVVVFQAGINDLKNIGLIPNRKTDIISNCKENLLKIVQRIGEQEIQLVVLTIFPTGKPGLLRKWFWSEETFAAISEVNTSLKSIQNRKVHGIACERAI
jgi:hypothetical protein